MWTRSSTRRSLTLRALTSAAKIIRSEKLQNERSPNYSNFCPGFCPEFCSEFSPNFTRIFRASFRRKRRPEKNRQKSPAFFNAKFPGKNIHKMFLESPAAKGGRQKEIGKKVAKTVKKGDKKVTKRGPKPKKVTCSLLRPPCGTVNCKTQLCKNIVWYQSVLQCIRLQKTLCIGLEKENKNISKNKCFRE